MLFLLLFLLIPSISWAKMSSYYSPRVASSAGAGVGSLLMADSLFLNPASSAFFKKKSLSYFYQNNSGDLDGKSHTLAAMDTTAMVQGGLAYQTRNEFDNKRTRLTLNTSKNISPNLSLGVNYSYTWDKNSPAHYKKNWHQLTLGATYILSPVISLGAVVIDPFHRTGDESKIILGTHISVSQSFFLIGDISSQAFDHFSETFAWRSAAQIRIMRDFYFRLGFFNDKQENNKGSSLGFGWYAPKLLFDVSYRNIKDIDSSAKAKEINLGIGVRF